MICFASYGKIVARPTRRLNIGVWLLVMIGVVGMDVPLRAEGQSDRQHVQQYRSPHFVMQTDLPPRDARKLLTSLEATLRVMVAYWQRPVNDKIECFVIAEPDRWSSDDFPSRQALAALGKINGFTESREVEGESRRTVHSRVYATTMPGVAQHEITHAYHDQVFQQHDVPLWYKEGMAEVMSYHRGSDKTVRCRDEMVTYLQVARTRRVEKIIRNSHFTDKIMQSVTDMCREEGGKSESTSLDAMWGPADDEIFRRTRQDYCWAWALCHLLYHHPEYRERFQLFGRGFLSQDSSSFQELFAPVADQIDFELQQFVTNIDKGYRIDLCAWDWNAPFAPLTPGQAIRCDVDAKRGYQPTGLIIEADRRYRFTTTGTWSIGESHPKISASGTEQGAGRLVAGVLSDNKLVATFELGAEGEFIGPAAGKLYVRCQDEWAQLSDNSGAIALRITE